MEKRLNLELRGRQSHKVKELDLDGVKCGGEIDFGSYEFTSLEILSISNAGLTTLKNFPTLPNLIKLDLCKNRLSKGLESLKECKRLKYLMLTGNRFKPSKELEVLDPLASLPCLTHLELGDNFYPEDNHDQERIDVRTRIFSKLPSLQILDGDDVNGKPEEDNDEQDDEDDDDEDEDDEEDEDEEHGIMNGLRDDVIDGDDEFEEDDDVEDEEDEYDGGFGTDRNHFNGDINGTLQDYNDQSSDAEDEQDDDDDDDDDDIVNHPPVRGKKRKFDDEGIP